MPKAPTQTSNRPARTRRFGAWHWPLRLGTLLALAYALWLGALWTLQDQLIFPRHLVAWATRPAVPPRVEAWTIQTSEGDQVPAWLCWPAGRGAGGGGGVLPVGVVVWFHGNAELIDQVIDYREVEQLQELGLAVLLVEYRGYGRAGGKPSEAGLIADGVAFVDRLKTTPGIDATKMVYYGRSLGGGVALGVAAQRIPAAVILQSTFTSVASFANRYLAPQALVRHPFRNDQIVPTLDVPMLIMHGRHDRVTPVSHGRVLAALAKRGEYIEDDSDHVSGPADRDAYEAGVEAFLRRAGVLKP